MCLFKCLSLAYLTMISVLDMLCTNGCYNSFRETKQERRSLKANSCSPCQEIPHLLWNPKVYFRVHKSPSQEPILSQMNPVYTHTPYLFKLLILFPHVIEVYLGNSSYQVVTHYWYSWFLVPMMIIIIIIIIIANISHRYCLPVINIIICL
jgi:hypothetical protein